MSTATPVREVSSAQPAATGSRRSGLILATLLTCQLMIVLDVTVMNVALPKISSALHFTPTNLSWVMNAYTLVFGGLLLLGGRAGDLFGRKKMFIAGVTLFTLASLVGGLATTGTMLLAARVVQGIGAAMAGPSTLALLTTTFSEPKARIRALALFSGMSSAGFAVGLVAGGLLTEWFTWRSVMFINVPFGLVVVALATRFLPNPERRPAHLDLPGAFAATGGVTSIVYGFIHAAAHGWANTQTVTWLSVGVALLAGFVAIELRSTHPLVPMWLFADRNRAAAYVNFCLGPMAGMSMFFFMTQYLQEVGGLNALRTGFAFLPMAVIVFTMSRLMPKLLPRFGPKPITLVGTASMASGVALLTQLTPHTAYFPMIFVAMVLMGFGMGLAFSPLNIIVMSSVPAEDAGAAGGALQTMQQTGAALGLAILVTIFGTAVREATGSPHQVLVTGMTHAFIASMLIASLTFVVALTFRKAPQ